MFTDLPINDNLLQNNVQIRFPTAFRVPDVRRSRTVRWRTSLGRMENALSDTLGRHSRAGPLFSLRLHTHRTPAKLRSYATRSHSVPAG